MGTIPVSVSKTACMDLEWSLKSLRRNSICIPSSKARKESTSMITSQAKYHRLHCKS
ncbi:uncharacterized protein LACBIDRAFT_313833 [Laccaria bicolor S238N-H82]|uniref:Predicted protein n=1 Tax=Laccaria bicolor (strain S238N-H82 / ATCC MYA-4686) TaxID=486041 RepID=B0D0Y1_LACBS|nr:uncharacterized protein LACBIDRAFT_313833 [Laccaria bicolor S238N-H82]EDR11909.1 predicted protein [Laccaria bicolor S238N-H82]|eukprot:XP_001877806.1 predicted protein [Laccaria bicolor S238N-H82]